jgi:predicted MPP superfamily phosphohydrolase
MAALLVAVLLYAAAGLELFRMLWRVRAGAGGPQAGRFRRWARRALLAGAGLGLLCLPYAWRVEPYWPNVERVRVESAKLSSGTGPVRLVLLADTHCDPVARCEGRLPDLVRGLRPDAIVFAGDAINSEQALPVFRRLATRLAAIAPTYSVRGNWEVWWFRHLELTAGTGMVQLDGEAVPIRARGAEIWLGGVAVENDTGVRKALSRVPSGAFAVLAHHYPQAAPGAIREGADLVLSGDTHGGQVRLPLVGALVRITRGGSREYRDIGLQRVGDGWLYVSRGIGMEGGRAPRVRFLCRPEVTLVEIAPAN